MASTAAQAVFNSGWSVRTPHLVSSNGEFRSWAPNTSLGTLSAEALQELESIMSIVVYDAGSILFLEQQPLSQVFVVFAGNVRLSLQDISGRRLTLRIARRGAVLGVHSALFGSLSEWSADTLYSSKIALIKYGDFLRFSRRYPEVYRLATDELMGASGTPVRLCIVGLSSCTRKRLASQLFSVGRARQQNWGPETEFCMALTDARSRIYRRSARVAHVR